jgi:hypothetical protein
MAPGISIKVSLHYGENSAKLVCLKERKNYITFSKRSNISVIFAIVETNLLKFGLKAFTIKHYRFVMDRRLAYYIVS